MQGAVVAVLFVVVVVVVVGVVDLGEFVSDP